MQEIRLAEKLPEGKGRLIIIGAIVIIALGSIIYVFTTSRKPALAPTYDVVLPQRTTIETLGGWQRVNPSGSDPVFAYSDTIDDTAISVSQQPLPASFVGNVDAKVKELADNYSATTVIEAGGTKAYIGRSAKGPQSIIFAKNNTLVLIKSQKAISQADWIQYINTLVDPKTEKTPTF